MDATCLPPCALNAPVNMPSNQMPQFFPLNSGGGSGTLPPYSPENSYGEGTVVAYNGKYYAANADIPAGTPFTVGTSGATWREINLATATIPPFSPSKDYTQYEAVDYLGVLYTAIDQHSAGPWDPDQWKPLATSGGVTIDVASTQTITMTGDGSSGDPVKGEVIIATALPDNILLATGSGLFAAMSIESDDSTTIELTGDGTNSSLLVADVKISASAGNQLVVDGSGLFVPAPAAAAITATDTATIDFTGNGTAGTPLTAAVKKSATANNALVLDATGLWVPTFASTDTATIDFTGAGTAASPLTAQVKRSANAGNILTQELDGLYATAIGMSDVKTTDTATIDFSGDGTVATPLTASVKRSATAGNALTENADGLYAPTVTPGIASVTATDTATIDFSGLGTAGNALTAAVRKATKAGNALTLETDGLWVPNMVPTGGTTGQFLRKKSATDLDTEWAFGVRLLTDGATARTLALTDQDQTLLLNAAAVKTLTVPTNATVAMPIGSNVPVFNTGAADLTIAPAAGVTINKPADQSLVLKQFCGANLIKTGTNEWLLTGAMTPL